MSSKPSERGQLTPERVIATLVLTESAELVFYVDYWKEKTWANVRKFIRGERYTGATKAGIKLEPSAVPRIAEALARLCTAASDMTEDEVLRIPASGNRFIVLRGSLYKGVLAADLRVWFKSRGGELPTKQGVRIPVEMLDKALDCFKQLAVAETPQEASALFVRDASRTAKDTTGSPVDGVPAHLTGLFDEEES